MNEELRILKNILIFLSTGDFKLNVEQASELFKSIDLLQSKIKELEHDITKPEYISPGTAVAE